MPRSATGGIQSARQVVTQFFLTAPVAEAEALLEIAVTILASRQAGSGEPVTLPPGAAVQPDGRVRRGRRSRTGLPAILAASVGLSPGTVTALPDQGTPGDD